MRKLKLTAFAAIFCVCAAQSQAQASTSLSVASNYVVADTRYEVVTQDGGDVLVTQTAGIFGAYIVAFADAASIAGTLTFTITYSAADAAASVYTYAPAYQDYNFGSVSAGFSETETVDLSGLVPGNSFSIFPDYAFQGTILITSTAPASVPEPITLSLFGAGLFGLGMARRRTARPAASHDARSAAIHRDAAKPHCVPQ